MGLRIWRPDGSVLFDITSRPGRITGTAAHSGPGTVTQTIGVPTGPGKRSWMSAFPWGDVRGGCFDNGDGTWTYSLTLAADATVQVYWGDR